MNEYSSNFKNLQNAVISLSESYLWLSAINEWSILDCEEDRILSQSCVCGKEKL